MLGHYGQNSVGGYRLESGLFDGVGQIPSQQGTVHCSLNYHNPNDQSIAPGIDIAVQVGGYPEGTNTQGSRGMGLFEFDDRRPDRIGPVPGTGTYEGSRTIIQIITQNNLNRLVGCAGEYSFDVNPGVYRNIVIGLGWYGPHVGSSQYYEIGVGDQLYGYELGEWWTPHGGVPMQGIWRAGKAGYQTSIYCSSTQLSLRRNNNRRLLSCLFITRQY